MNNRKKILIGYIQNGYAGGVDKYILNLISSVRKEIYEITLLSNQMDLELCERLEKDNVILCSVPSLKNPIKQYRSIKKIIDENKYDVVYFNISTAIHCLGLLAAKKCKVANRIVHSHSSDVDIENKYKRCIMRILHNFCKKLISNSATTFVGCSQRAGEWMFTPKVLKTDNYFVVHNSVNLKKFIYDDSIRQKMRKEMGWINKKVLIHVANFTYQKNNEFIIEVFKRVYKKEPDSVLVLIGKGTKEERIRDLVKQYGLEDSVFFFKDIPNVYDYLQAADLFLLPSHFEGYPISALEAQVNGVPCFLSDKITKESKITETCVFLPLKVAIWAEEILCAPARMNTEVVLDMVQFDNSNLSSTIEMLWDSV